MRKSACQTQAWAMQPRAAEAFSGEQCTLPAGAAATEVQCLPALLPINGQLLSGVAAAAHSDMCSGASVTASLHSSRSLFTPASAGGTRPATDRGHPDRWCMSPLRTTELLFPLTGEGSLDRDAPTQRAACFAFLDSMSLVSPTEGQLRDSVQHRALGTSNLRPWAAPLWALSSELCEVRYCE